MSTDTAHRPATPTPDTRAAALSSGSLPGLVAVMLVVGGLAAVLMGLLATPALGDQGLFTRVTYPLARAVFDVAAVITLGTCVFTAFALPLDGPAARRAAGLVVTSAMTWAVAAAACLILGASDVAGVPLSQPGFGTVLIQFATSVEVGQLMLWSLGLVMVLTVVLVLLAPKPRVFGWGAGLSAVALIPTALSGHAAGPGHEIVGSSWWLHALGLGAWVGGLVALTLLRRDLAEPLEPIRRYSALAGWGFGFVAFSGVAGSIPRLTSPSDLVGTGYGRLLVLKAVLIIALGLAGWWHRRRTIAQLADGTPAPFWRLVAVEALVMGAATGLAVVLGRSAPPVPEELSPNPGPAEIATGQVLPPPINLTRLITGITWDVLWIVACLVLLVTYLWAVRKLHRRGDKWPVHRTILWVVGCLVLLYITCGGIALYGRLYFSVHMFDHMALSMIGPPFLVMGAPITLLLRATSARHDGSRGLREWVLAVVHSGWVTFFSHPVVAALNFAGSLIIFYYSNLFGLALTTHLGHELMMLHFTAAGYLFVDSMIGVDPAPNRLPFPMRILVLFVTMAFHAFFAVSLMSTDVLLEARYFSSLGLGIDALADQKDGGAITWGVGEIPTLILAILVGVAWARSDGRASRRADRAADRDGDAELARYNAMLAEIRRQDEA